MEYEIRPGDIATWYHDRDMYGNDACELLYLVCGVLENVADENEVDFDWFDNPERHITIMLNRPNCKMEFLDRSYVLCDDDTKDDMKIIRFDET